MLFLDIEQCICIYRLHFCSDKQFRHSHRSNLDRLVMVPVLVLVLELVLVQELVLELVLVLVQELVLVLVLELVFGLFL